MSSDAHTHESATDELGDLTDQVVLLREGIMDRPEREHPLWVWGGFGTTPPLKPGSGGKIFGVCLTCGEQTVARREFVERIIDGPELNDAQREQLAQEPQRRAEEQARHYAEASRLRELAGAADSDC
jgi:hypothetical protein